MIDKALQVLRNGIQGYLARLPDLSVNSKEIVVLSNIVEAEGKLALPDERLGITLVNIEEERVTKSQQAFNKAVDGRIRQMNPEIKLNLYIMLVANWDDYRTGLEFLSGAIRFFQSKSVFTSDNTPDLDPVIRKLIVEMTTLNFEQQNHMWGSLGAKYMPSVLYKVRMITIQEALATGEGPPITIIKFSEKGA